VGLTAVNAPAQEGLEDLELARLWRDFLDRLESFDERVAEILRLQNARPVLPTALCNDVVEDWDGNKSVRGLKAIIWPEPFDFHVQLLRCSTPLLMKAAQRVTVRGFRVSEIHVSDVWSFDGRRAVV
jgi:hypothetical protein